MCTCPIYLFLSTGSDNKGTIGGPRQATQKVHKCSEHQQCECRVNIRIHGAAANYIGVPEVPVLLDNL